MSELPPAHQLVEEIVARDRVDRGYALALLRGLIARLTPGDRQRMLNMLEHLATGTPSIDSLVG